MSYQDIAFLFLAGFFLGFVFTLILVAIVFRIDAQKQKENEDPPTLYDHISGRYRD